MRVKPFFYTCCCSYVRKSCPFSCSLGLCFFSRFGLMSATLRKQGTVLLLFNKGDVLEHPMKNYFPWLLDNSLLNWCIASLKHTYRSLPKSAYLSMSTVLTHESLVSQRSVGLLVSCFILCMEQWKLRHWWLSPRPPGERVAEPVVALWGIHTQSQASTNLDISLYHLISD